MSKFFKLWTNIDENFKICNCGQDIACYRCQIEINSNLDYHKFMNIIELERVREPFRKIFKKLLPYHSSNSLKIIQWIACDKCIDKEVKENFAFIKNGWFQKEKEFIKYENLKIKSRL
jgi:hypothetical protein